MPTNTWSALGSSLGQAFGGGGSFQKGQLDGAHMAAYESTAALNRAKAEEVQRRAQYQNPANATSVGAAFAGLSDGQGQEVANFQRNGNWGVNPAIELPPEQDGPTRPAMNKPAPDWATPQTLQRVNQGRGAFLASLGGTGDSNSENIASAFAKAAEQGRIDSALEQSPQALNSYRAAMNGKLFDATTRGIIDQSTGIEAVNPDWQKSERGLANQRNASAVNSAASAALHRAQIPEVQSRIDLNRSKIGGETVTMPDGTVVQNSFGKAPSGYRFKQDGSMEPIPGGPADMKAQTLAGNKSAGVTDVNSAVATLRDAYDRLEKGNGITSTTNGALSNLAASSSSSAIGQAVGRSLGTENQSARNTIAMTRPALLASLMKATGMSAKQMDSNAELKLWMATATDPTLDIQSNRDALTKIEQKYLGGESSPVQPAALSSVPDAAIAKLKSNPSLANAFAAKYGKEAADAALGKGR